MNIRQFPIFLWRFGARLFVLLFCLAVNPLHAQEESEYVRFVQGNTELEGELQTAVVSFENEAGVQLNLVAAVHLGRTVGRPQLAAGSWGLQAEILGARMGWSGGQRGGAWGAGASRG